MEDQTPEIENQFLKNMLAFNEMKNVPHIEIRTLFPLNFKFPKTDQLSDEALEKKLDKIKDILKKNDIYLDLRKKCPDQIIYQYVLDEVLPLKIAVSRPEGLQHHIDGCDGWCPGCFQQPFCDSWKDIWDEDELKAQQ